MRRSQRGIALVLVMVGLLALVAMAGLAIDTGRIMTNKARLQSTVDAAALAAAKVLGQTGSQDQAYEAARLIFVANRARFPDLASVNLGRGDVTFSRELYPFTAGTPDPRFVRVRVGAMPFAATLTSVLGIAELRTGASAVAGPSPSLDNPGGEICDLAPIFICGDTAAGQAGNWGYAEGQVVGLKLDSNNSAVGPGNFQLLRLPGDEGGADIRRNLAGASPACTAINDTLPLNTEPGNKAGPTAQGLNTRFDVYQGAGQRLSRTDYPPDVVTTPRDLQLSLQCANDVCQVVQGGQRTPILNSSQLSSNFSTYTNRLRSNLVDNSYGVINRRVIAVPVGQCPAGPGRTEVTVSGFACFFLLQQVEQSDATIIGEFVRGCGSRGNPGGEVPNPNPGTATGPYVIQLYDDDASSDS